MFLVGKKNQQYVFYWYTTFFLGRLENMEPNLDDLIQDVMQPTSERLH